MMPSTPKHIFHSQIEGLRFKREAVQEDDRGTSEGVRTGGRIWIRICLYLPFPLVVDLCPAVGPIEDITDRQRDGQPVRLRTLPALLCVSRSVVTNMQETFWSLGWVPSVSPADHFFSILSASAEILLQDYLGFDMTDPNILFS